MAAVVVAITGVSIGSWGNAQLGGDRQHRLVFGPVKGQELAEFRRLDAGRGQHRLGRRFGCKCPICAL